MSKKDKQELRQQVVCEWLEQNYLNWGHLRHDIVTDRLQIKTYPHPLPEGKGVNTAHQTYAIGDTVEVIVQQKMGWKAVVLAYLLPFFVMLAVMFIGNGLLAMGDGATGLLGDEAKREAVLGTVALCAMAVYYLVLGMFKDKLQKEFSFTAKKKN